MKKNIISALSFAAAFFAVQYGMDYYKEYSAVNRASAEIEFIREYVRKNNPDEPEVLAVQQAAIKKSEENINSKATQKEKVQTAAGTFLGFYLVNYRQRTEYCQNQGVDITSFTSAFKDSHKNEYAIAVKAVSASPSDVDKLFNMLKPQLVTVIEQDMEFIASENRVSLPEACKLISDNASILIPEMHISVMQPLVHSVLMSGA
ncbi:hypothetical protein [Dasania marina]|uniref:hypothetical protein n=1 Tax=Dasania marina TaxID=471499 RepID=UPI0030DCB696|tara:strand:+ start:784 stop:1395 length:612 start_codon:yes stop_codon:yes gene_type:complete